MSEKTEFKPYIPADKVMPELTVTSVVLGLILAVIFGAANAYLGLTVGMTVSASIPAAVISMGIVRVIMKRNSILENNMVQTIGSAGESLAAGAIFTLPALFMWADESGIKSLEPSFWTITIIALLAGVLGVLFMIPLRTSIIVEEHGTLPFPEGTACSEVLLAGEEGGEKSKTVFSGLGIAAAFKFIADGIKAFPSEVACKINALKTGIGMDLYPALIGVGYISGIKVSSYIFAGGILGWFVFIPCISLFGLDAVIAPGAAPISTLAPDAIWGSYVRYIGAGAVAAGGIISLIKSLPMILKTFGKAIKGFGHNAKAGETVLRTEKDMPMIITLLGSLAIAILIWVIPSVPVSLLGALLVVIFGFFFATVSSRMVGLVGSSNNPISGMVIATLLIVTAILKATGSSGFSGMAAAICVGTIVSIVAAMSGDTSQDLKTGYIVGATPVKQQMGEIFGAVVSAFAIAGIMYLLHAGYGFGERNALHPNALPAPQGTMMKLVVEGVMGGSLPWGLIFCGAAVAVMLEILKIPVLPFAVGLYLPIYLSVPIFIGGILRFVIEKIEKKNGDKAKGASDKGVLYCSGMIAGEGIVGILLAVFAVVKVGNGSLADVINLGGPLGSIGGIICFALLLGSLFYFSLKKNKKKNA